MSIYKTVPRCKICNHPERPQIEGMFLIMTRVGTYQAFCDKVQKQYGISEVSCKSHFKGRGPKGREAHFVCTFDEEYLEEKFNLDADRIIIERLGMDIVADQLKKMKETKGYIKNSDLVSLLNAVNKSKDSRKMVKLKEKELGDTDKRFNKLLNATLYGSVPIESDGTVIRDAEVYDSSSDLGKIESPAAE